MSKFEKFMKANKVQKENVTYPATESLCDEDGEPLLWEIRHLTSKEIAAIRRDYVQEVPDEAAPGGYREKVRAEDMVTGFVVAAVASPDLYNKDLQDSYGVTTPLDLLYAMVDDPGEFEVFRSFVLRYLGLGKNRVDEAKN